MFAPANLLRVSEQSDSLCLLQLWVESWQCQCLSDLMLREVTVNEFLYLKILELSELSPNVNSLDIGKKLLLKTWLKKTCVILRTLPWGLDTLSWSHISSLDLTIIHLSSCSHFFYITAGWLLLALHLHLFVLFQASLNPIIVQPLLCASDVWHFVIKSALFCFVLMYARFVNFFSTTSCTYLYFSITCRNGSW